MLKSFLLCSLIVFVSCGSDDKSSPSSNNNSPSNGTIFTVKTNKSVNTNSVFGIWEFDTRFYRKGNESIKTEYRLKVTEKTLSFASKCYHENSPNQSVYVEVTALYDVQGDIVTVLETKKDTKSITVNNEEIQCFSGLFKDETMSYLLSEGKLNLKWQLSTSVENYTLSKIAD